MIEPADNEFVSSTVRRSGRADPIYFIGDSSTMAFRNRLYKDTATNRSFIGRSIYLPGLCAADMSSATGELHPHVVSALALENLIVGNALGGWEAFRWDISAVTQFVASVSELQDNQPAIVFSLGGLDGIRLLEEFGEAEIDLPDFLPTIPGDPIRDAPHYSFEYVCDVARPYVQPYARAMEKLQSFGLTNLFMHDLAPSETDNVEFHRLFTVASNVRSRHQCFIVVNFLIREIAEKLGIGFIELWPRVITNDGRRDRRFSRDGVHLNSRAAVLSVNAVIEDMRTGSEMVAAQRKTISNITEDGYGVESDYDFVSLRRPVFEEQS